MKEREEVHSKEMLEECLRKVDSYVPKIMDYLTTGKMNMKPGLYMDTYTDILKMCDEFDKAAEMYHKYQKLLDDYVQNVVYHKVQQKVGDTREMLQEYVH
jgi:hypothetical protein